MSEQITPRKRWLHVRLSEDEHLVIRQKFASTTERKMSDYLRKIIFQKPVIRAYRNQSTDDFVAEMVQLRSELNSIAKNFNQVVKRLHSFPNADFVRGILKEYEADKNRLLEQVNTIQSFIEKHAEKW